MSLRGYLGYQPGCDVYQLDAVGIHVFPSAINEVSPFSTCRSQWIRRESALPRREKCWTSAEVDA